MQNDNMMRIKPIEKKEEILHLLSGYDPIVHTKDEEEYEWLEYDDCVEISVSREGEEIIYITLADGEITLGAAGWHAHYSPYGIDYNEFIKDLECYLSNEMCVVHVICNGDWVCGFSLESEKVNEDELITHAIRLADRKNEKRMRELGYSIRCRFLDLRNDVILEIKPIVEQ